jgi:hypothetical protein
MNQARNFLNHGATERRTLCLCAFVVKALEQRGADLTAARYRLGC